MKVVLYLDYNQNYDYGEIVGLGLAGRIIFEHLQSLSLNVMPNFIKSMVYTVSKSWTHNDHLTFEITSTTGWYARDKFYEPYQIWKLRKTEQMDFYIFEENLVTVDEIKNLDVAEYAIKSIIAFTKKLYAVKYSRMEKFTDEKRLLVTDLPIAYTAKEELDIDLKKYLNLYLMTVLMDLPSNLANQAEERLEIFKDTLLTNWENQSFANSDSMESVGRHNIVNMMED
ncbi:hypothetical protein AMTR_s00168p00019630 [Amborella trichopoda]|uniref:Uncharacterized protein n=1 Tax=Amborella trichopoda TaxID=13333 RepID=W1PQ40_AMBTC|nr:hypothetical protein AMTR_s00168p00019630 [Amborella trichopoda]